MQLKHCIEVAILDDIEDRRKGLPFDRSGLPADLDQRRADVESLVRTFDGDAVSADNRTTGGLRFA